MKKLALLSIFAFLLLGCNAANQPATETDPVGGAAVEDTTDLFGEEEAIEGEAMESESMEGEVMEEDEAMMEEGHSEDDAMEGEDAMMEEEE